MSVGVSGFQSLDIHQNNKVVFHEIVPFHIIRLEHILLAENLWLCWFIVNWIDFDKNYLLEMLSLSWTEYTLHSDTIQ